MEGRLMPTRPISYTVEYLQQAVSLTDKPEIYNTGEIN